MILIIIMTIDAMTDNVFFIFTPHNVDVILVAQFKEYKIVGNGKFIFLFVLHFLKEDTFIV